jgi:outer membrane protein
MMQAGNHPVPVRSRVCAVPAAVGILMLVLGCGVAMGQPAPAPAPTKLVLNPLSAAQLALRNSLDLQVDREGIEQALARIDQAEATGKLTAQLSAQVSWMGPIATLSIPGSPGGGFSLGNVFNDQETLSLSHPLYTGGRLAAQRNLAKRGVDLARVRPEATARATALAARDVVYTILRLKQLGDVASQRATAAAEHLALSQKLFEGGTVAKFEVVQAETDLAQAKGDVIAAQVAVDQAKAGLRQTLVVPQTTEIEVEDGVPPQTPPGDLPKLVDTAWQGRPEVKLSEAGVRTAEASLRLLRQSKSFSVNAFAQLTHQTATAASQPDVWMFGVSASKPILDGGLEDAQVREQLSKIREAKVGVEQTRQQIALDVTQQFLAIGQAQEQLKVAEAGELNARERLRIAKIRFESAVALGIEVIDAQTALAAAEAATINARYDLQTATARLRSALGIDDVGGAPKQ